MWEEKGKYVKSNEIGLITVVVLVLNQLVVPYNSVLSGMLYEYTKFECQYSNLKFDIYQE